ncbi:MaoC/PaaZ C-terminal domain-containing protein [Nocardioides cynanchi]|uniref:MaoC/PaaZ C-terminal domain-containing protein n=1 Tax=Nocardioides cynanchi TaxID=2558918 RepID=UPI001245EC27|nr:MaoC/PaaZ C-terminal domain-containing protein [Nocardioides cynanchi]
MVSTGSTNEGTGSTNEGTGSANEATGSTTEVRIVHGEPGGVTTLLRAALPSIPLVNQLPGVRRSGGFEGLAFARPAVTIERAPVSAYAQVCGFPVKDTVPLTYPHVLAFPLHLAILSDPSFPFPAVGAVHVANVITAHRPVAIGETVTVTVRADEVRPHPKGRTVDVVARIDAGGEVVWESTSTYLRRGRGDSEAHVPDGPTDVPTGRVTWPLPADLGRRYAGVSGDHNPIHLYPLTAKALGFPRQIAHGMWSLARCVAAVENRLPDAVTVEAAFKKPILLPGSVGFGVEPGSDGGLAFALTSPKDGAPHLVGRTRSA